jgi:hypothetical protein
MPPIKEIKNYVVEPLDIMIYLFFGTNKENNIEQRLCSILL